MGKNKAALRVCNCWLRKTALRLSKIFCLKSSITYPILLSYYPKRPKKFYFFKKTSLLRLPWNGHVAEQNRTAHGLLVQLAFRSSRYKICGDHVIFVVFFEWNWLNFPISLWNHLRKIGRNFAGKLYNNWEDLQPMAKLPRHSNNLGVCYGYCQLLWPPSGYTDTRAWAWPLEWPWHGTRAIIYL